MSGKPWGELGLGPTEMSRRVAARQAARLEEARKADFHTTLSSEERYARQHEALRRLSEALVEGVSEFFDDAMKVQRREAMEGEEDLAALESVKAEHVKRVAKVLLGEALERIEARERESREPIEET